MLRSMKRPTFDTWDLRGRLGAAREWLRRGGDLSHPKAARSRLASRHMRRDYGLTGRTLRRCLADLRDAYASRPGFWPAHPYTLELTVRAMMSRPWADGSDDFDTGGTFNRRWALKPTGRDLPYLWLDGLDAWLRGTPSEGRAVLLDAARGFALGRWEYNRALYETWKDQLHGYNAGHEPARDDEVVTREKLPGHGRGAIREKPARASGGLPRGLARGKASSQDSRESLAGPPRPAGSGYFGRWHLPHVPIVPMADRVPVRTVLRSPAKTGWRWHCERYAPGVPSTPRRGPAVPEHEHPYRDAYAIRDPHERRAALAVAARRAAAIEAQDAVRWIGYRLAWGSHWKAPAVGRWRKSVDPFKALRERWADRTYKPAPADPTLRGQAVQGVADPKRGIGKNWQGVKRQGWPWRSPA